MRPTRGGWRAEVKALNSSLCCAALSQRTVPTTGDIPFSIFSEEHARPLDGANERPRGGGHQEGSPGSPIAPLVHNVTTFEYDEQLTT